jgi:hypothetical protein
MSPELAIVSNEQKIQPLKVAGRKLARGLFPHSTAVAALEECGARIATTDGSYEGQLVDGKPRDAEWNHPGTVVMVIPPGGSLRKAKLADKRKEIPPVLTEV